MCNSEEFFKISIPIVKQLVDKIDNYYTISYDTINSNNSVCRISLKKSSIRHEDKNISVTIYETDTNKETTYDYNTFESCMLILSGMLYNGLDFYTTSLDNFCDANFKEINLSPYSRKQIKIPMNNKIIKVKIKQVVDEFEKNNFNVIIDYLRDMTNFPEVWLSRFISDKFKDGYEFLRCAKLRVNTVDDVILDRPNQKKLLNFMSDDDLRKLCNKRESLFFEENVKNKSNNILDDTINDIIKDVLIKILNVDVDYVNSLIDRYSSNENVLNYINENIFEGYLISGRTEIIDIVLKNKTLDYISNCKAIKMLDYPFKFDNFVKLINSNPNLTEKFRNTLVKKSIEYNVIYDSIYNNSMFDTTYNVEIVNFLKKSTQGLRILANKKRFLHSEHFNIIYADDTIDCNYKFDLKFPLHRSVHREINNYFKSCDLFRYAVLKKNIQIVEDDKGLWRKKHSLFTNYDNDKDKLINKLSNDSGDNIYSICIFSKSDTIKTQDNQELPKNIATYTKCQIVNTNIVHKIFMLKGLHLNEEIYCTIQFDNNNHIIFHDQYNKFQYYEKSHIIYITIK